MTLACVGALRSGVSCRLRDMCRWRGRARRSWRRRSLRTVRDGRIGSSRCRDCWNWNRSGRLRLRSRCRLCYRCFRNRLNGDTTAAPAAFRSGGLGLRFRSRRGSGRSAAATRRGRRSGNTRALLTLPAGADAGDLVITQRTEMAAHRYVHLAKEIDHLVAGNAEFARQIMYSKLAQPISSLRPSGIGARLSA